MTAHARRSQLGKGEIVEYSVTSSLNLFDIAVRLVPGALVLAACGFFSGWCSDICGDDAITLFLAFVASCTVGTLLRFLAWPLSELIHLVAYDGNPRDRYLDRGSREGRLGFTGRSVIRDPSTRALGFACRRAIAGHYGLKHVEPRFAFGFMINYLEAEGVSAKGDRMCSISDMCSSLNVVFPIDPCCEMVYEDESVGDTEERIRRFGKYEHLRVFRRDSAELLGRAGFVVHILRGSVMSDGILPVVTPADYDSSDVFLCTRN